jgi:RNA polymerase sigma-70 factor (ECF subfamily)
VVAGNVASTAEQVARDSYGRLLAILAAPTRDIAAAEDALSDAFVQALRTWPDAGIPANPEGWLLTVSRNRLRDLYGSSAYRLNGGLQLAPGASATDRDPDSIPDKRLALLFACAHPAVDAAIHTPLMMQVVLGLEAEQVARAFAVTPASMAQRLVRAKRRIRETGIRFEIPDRDAMPARLLPVLEAVYGAYAVALDRPDGEALYLSLTLADLSNDPEALGLAALISFSMSRDRRGDYVPLNDQDPSLWDRGLIAQGERLLARAHTHGRVGRFQLEAAIQSVHAGRARSGMTDTAALRTLYAGLVAIAPSLGARVALAVADESLAELDTIEGANDFQPWWAARAHLLSHDGKADAAASAYDRAIALTTEPRVREYLLARRAALPGRPS